MEPLQEIQTSVPKSQGGQGAARDKRLQEYTESQPLRERMGRIRHKVMVLSGKGGVGKSTVAVNLAVALAMEGKRIGILDLDFHGPSIPKLLRLEGERPRTVGHEILPVVFAHGIQVMSMGFLLPGEDSAVIWRGPVKMGAIKQLLSEVSWGDLDYLIIDFPPGTGDEALSAAQLLPESDGAVIVTTPQDLSLTDVRKSIDFCRQVKVPILGVLENMSGLVCPHCQGVIDVFKRGGGEAMARQAGVPFLGRIPMDPLIVESSDSGTPFVYHNNGTEAAKAFSRAILPILDLETGRKEAAQPRGEANEATARNLSRFAVPVAGGRLCAHFGHCETFALLDVDEASKTIVGRQDIEAPPHEPGLLPRWLQERGATTIIAGGMGSRARGLFDEQGIRVIVGATPDEPEAVVQAYLSGTLVTGENVCDH